MKPKALFICLHNSARSQMAQAWCTKLCGGFVDAESAGFEPGELNPAAVRAMAEVGIDISGNRTKSIFDLYRQGKMFRYVISVCDEAAAEKCPVFPAPSIRMHWNILNPATAGDDTTKLQKARETRDLLRTRMEQWRAELTGTTPKCHPWRSPSKPRQSKFEWPSFANESPPGGSSSPAGTAR